MVYMISYDLNKPGQNYEDLYQKIKDASTGVWCHPMDSTWLIQSTVSAESVYNTIKPAIDASDSILIAQITQNYFGVLPKDLWEYIKNMF